MAELRRIVLPGIPHHITLRGNRRERTFFEDGSSIWKRAPAWPSPRQNAG
ncbi:hypothetical protein ACFQ1E_20765 [Sphingomonas canadensis]|uniref:Transposase n=1 Tax=Sphingomonas canadensis TaxID=1219257 RepID=A0ABW3HBE3_9SPHN|nr:hypothetical protein [Sphingomonas canadensis]MCW3838475.1 hypothetical protein [Sphingomonas canadensis]